MLVLSRRVGESVVLDGELFVKVVELRLDKVRLGFEWDREVAVHRKEVWDALNEGSSRGNPRDRLMAKLLARVRSSARGLVNNEAQVERIVDAVKAAVSEARAQG